MGWLGKEFLGIIEKQKNFVRNGAINLALILIWNQKHIWDMVLSRKKQVIMFVLCVGKILPKKKEIKL